MLKELWNNIFESGATPALVKATHAAFTFLLITISAMFYATRSYHFIALFVLAIGLWAAVTWFVKEYNAFLEQQNAANKKEE